jgi:flagellar biosynthesis protein FlhB
MYQLFTLFVLSLGFSGVLMAFSFLDDKLSIGEILREEAVVSPRFLMIQAIILGSLTILKLIFGFPGGIPVIGDILPVLVGGLSTLILLTENRALRAQEAGEELTGLFASVQNLFLSRRTLVGILVIIVALIHFILPSAVIL